MSAISNLPANQRFYNKHSIDDRASTTQQPDNLSGSGNTNAEVSTKTAAASTGAGPMQNEDPSPTAEILSRPKRTVDSEPSPQNPLKAALVPAENIQEQQNYNLRVFSALKDDVISKIPSIDEIVRGKIKSGIKEKIGLDVDPDKLHLNIFDFRGSSGTSFNGWQYPSPPVRSMTLTEVGMANFPAISDLGTSSDTNAMQAIYTEESNAPPYDKQFQLLASDLRDIIRSGEMQSAVTDQLDRFFKENKEDWRAVAKGQFVASAQQAYRDETLSPDDYELVMAGAAPNVPIGRVPNIEQLRAEASPESNVDVHRLDINGYTSSDILRFVSKDGREVIYTPGDTQAFHAFENAQVARDWVAKQGSTPETREVFAKHFSLYKRQDGNSFSGVDNYLKNLGSGEWIANDSSINKYNERVSADVFSDMAQQAETRVRSDADMRIKSNSEVTADRWLASFKAGNQVFGPLALANPISAGLGAASFGTQIGLESNQAIHGDTQEERQEGVKEVIKDSVTAVVTALVTHQPGEIDTGIGTEITQTLPEPEATREVSSNHAKLPESGASLGTTIREPNEPQISDGGSAEGGVGSQVQPYGEPPVSTLTGEPSTHTSGGGITPSSPAVDLSQYAVWDVNTPKTMPEHRVFTKNGSPYHGGADTPYVQGNDGNVYQVKNVRSAQQTGTGYVSVDVVDPQNPDGLKKATLYRAPDDTRWRTQDEVGFPGGMKRSVNRMDSTEPQAKQAASQLTAEQLKLYRAKLKDSYNQNDAAIDKILKAAENGTLTRAQANYHDAGMKAVNEMPPPASNSTTSSPTSAQRVSRPSETVSRSLSSVQRVARVPEPGMPDALARMREVPRGEWPPYLYHYTSEQNYSQMRSISDNTINYSTVDWHTPVRPLGVFMTHVSPEGNSLVGISKAIFPSPFKFENLRPKGVARYFKFDTSKMPLDYRIYKSDTPGSQEYFVRGTEHETMGLTYKGGMSDGIFRNYLVDKGDTAKVSGKSLTVDELVKLPARVMEDLPDSYFESLSRYELNKIPVDHLVFLDPDLLVRLDLINLPDR
ncbi:TPA: hypothetical protein QDC03_007485 [Burkholderia cepacia]|uniref:dermonecrotic toxin domain-containing protein n=1 Tax=Burkholderia cepacia TaxID=292 RepID=UPI0011B1FC24|nr:DUF6543 domain-containing protein [Burkholderia cepacia]HDR9512217.1 hypothetical protein [Burkholderia cepacia]